MNITSGYKVAKKDGGEILLIGGEVRYDEEQFPKQEWFDNHVDTLRPIDLETLDEIINRDDITDIMLGSSDWTEQIVDFYQIVQLVSEAGKRFHFQTLYDIETFEGFMGEAYINVIGEGDYGLNESVHNDDDYGIYKFIFMTIMDEFFPDGYEVVTGYGDKVAVYSIKNTGEDLEI